MLDRLFSITLTFAILAGGTLAIGGEWFGNQPAQSPNQLIAELPRVVVTGSVQPTNTTVATAEGETTAARTERVQ